MLAQDIVRYVSKFQRSDRHNFLLAKKHRENILQRTIFVLQVLMQQLSSMTDSVFEKANIPISDVCAGNM